MQSRDHGDAPAASTLGDQRGWRLALRRARVATLQAERLVSWSLAPRRWQLPRIASSLPDHARDSGGGAHLVYQREVAIARTDASADPILERGKRINLAIAAPHFDGLLVRPDAPLSFWRVLGRCTRARGYRHGMELRGGCIVPTLGGGLCLLSNALFRMACELGWTIVERHGHTMEAVPPPGDAPWGLDATVFWPHVDLRVAPREGTAWLRVRVVDQVLGLAVYADRAARVRVQLDSVGDVTYQRDGVRWRANRVIRRMYPRAGGPLLYQDVVADNRRRLLHQPDMRRTCLTCADVGCRARPSDLPTIALAGRR